MAEEQGFEPWVQGVPAQRISSAPRSTAPAPLRLTLQQCIHYQALERWSTGVLGKLHYSVSH